MSLPTEVLWASVVACFLIGACESQSGLSIVKYTGQQKHHTEELPYKLVHKDKCDWGSEPHAPRPPDNLQQFQCLIINSSFPACSGFPLCYGSKPYSSGSIQIDFKNRYLFFSQGSLEYAFLKNRLIHYWSFVADPDGPDLRPQIHWSKGNQVEIVEDRIQTRSIQIITPNQIRLVEQEIGGNCKLIRTINHTSLPQSETKNKSCLN